MVRRERVTQYQI